jgi:hypothetical protein
VRLDFLAGRFVDQRADLDAILEPVADPQFGHGSRKLVGEGAVHAVLDEQAIGANTGLAGVPELGRERKATAHDALAEVYLTQSARVSEALPESERRGDQSKETIIRCSLLSAFEHEANDHFWRKPATPPRLR